MSSAAVPRAENIKPLFLHTEIAVDKGIDPQWAM